MVSMLDSSGLIVSLSNCQVKPMTIMLVFVASLAIMQHLRARAKTGSAESGYVSEWNDMSTHGLLFQYASTQKFN